MRIFSYLNVSNGNDFERDSGFLFQRTLLSELATTHEVTLFAPRGAASLLPSIDVIELEWPDTKYAVRFGWPWADVAIALRTRPRPDVVLNNQCEVTVPLRLLLFERYGSDVPIVTYFHYLAVLERDGIPSIDPSLDDLGLGAVVWARQIEAAKASAATIIGSDYGATLLCRAAGLCRDELNLHVIPPPVTPGLVPGRHDGRTILYNHRLYDHYGSTSTFHALEEVCRTIDARVVVTDPTQRRSSERAELDARPERIRASLQHRPWVSFVDAQAWSQYTSVVAHASLGIAPDRPGALWSMAAVDLLAIGRPVLMPRRSGLGQAFGDERLLYSSGDELVAKAIDILSDTSLYEAAAAASSAFVEGLTPALISERFVDVLTMAIGSFASAT